jgi:glycine/D-amino acid oxidase-like deaminating enzyme
MAIVIEGAALRCAPFRCSTLKARAMPASIYADDFKTEPFWHEAAPLRTPPAPAPPPRCDVAIIGSGFTGLSAALDLARAGREVVVFEADALGNGCSTRNGGMIGNLLKVSLKDQFARYGRQAGIDMVREASDGLNYTIDLIKREAIKCECEVVGKFKGAVRHGDYDKLARELEFMHKEAGYQGEMVPRAEQHRIIDTDAYHGGRIEHGHGGLHPGLYHAGLLDRVLAEDVTLLAQTPVEGFEEDAEWVGVITAAGRTQARDVIVATNGYTRPVTPWLRRRLVPVGSYIIATEPLDTNVMERLLPGRHMITDTRKMIYYYRPSPDGTRMIFGARAAYSEVSDREGARRVHAKMVGIFPELFGVKVTHAWHGFVAMTFDDLPHTGARGRVHHACGYNGSGVAPATWLGHKTAVALIGNSGRASAFNDLVFPSRAFYTGNPWLLPAVLAWIDLRDRVRF